MHPRRAHLWSPGGEPTLAEPTLRRPAGTRRILHLSDPHLGKRRRPAPVEAWRRWLSHVDELDPDVLVISGDLVERPDDAAQMRKAAADLDAVGRPWLAVPGNHDIAHPGGPSPFYAIYGEYPRVERHAGLDFVLLDSMAGLPVGDRTPQERKQAGSIGFYSEGAVGALQRAAAAQALEALAERAEPARHRIVVVHHHLFFDDDPAHPRPMVPLHDTDDLLAFCREHHVDLLLHGHRHPYADPTVVGDLLVVRGPACTSPRHPVWLIDLADDHPELRLTELHLA